MKMHDKEKSERGLQILMMHDNETQTNGVPFNGREIWRGSSNVDGPWSEN